MSYVVLARKWRPMSFADLIGQEHVSRTLSNAIKQNRVAHAFLFTGVRGVGKTTSARILAKALNCLERSPDAVEPCLRCAACLEIAEGTDMDVREIDGASYNGVDEIRKLQDTLPYRPARDRFKIFIVDEVHMLSQNAWNALLKTLEEPPPHVKFILATTEVNKVPVTILSRVQRFDFKMISSRAIAARVRHVLEAEGIEADESAIAVVAREAAGSMRDALSLLDQVIAFSPERLQGDETARVLGVASYTSLHRIARAVIEGRAAEALEHVGTLVDQSCEPAVLARDLLALLRDLVVARLGASTDALLDLPEDEKRAVVELANSAEQSELLRLQQGFAKSFDDLTRAPEPRAALEMLLVRLALRPPLVPIDELLARLARLEARLSGGGTPGPGSPPPRRTEPAGRSGPAPRGAPGAARASAEPAQRGAIVGASRPGGEATSTHGGSPTVSLAAPASLAAPVSFVAPIPLATPASHAAPVVALKAAPAAPSPARPSPGAPPSSPAMGAPRAPSALGAARALPSAVAPEVVAAPPRAPALTIVPSASADEEPKPVVAASPQPPRGSAEPAPPVERAPVSTDVPKGASVAPSLPPLLLAWRGVLEHLGSSRPDVLAVLQHASPKRVDAERIVLGYASGSALEAMAKSDESMRLLQAAAERVWGKVPPISFEAAEAGALTLADADRRLREEQRRAAIERAERHPTVREAMAILGARIKHVHLGES